MRVASDQRFAVRKGFWGKMFEQIVGLLLLPILKSSHQGCSVGKGALKNVANFTKKHLCWSLF